MENKDKKINILVPLFTRVGTNTAILMSEFKFFETFQKLNPDVCFVFCPLSPFMERDLYKKVKLLNGVDYKILTIFGEEDLHKMDDSISGVFSYMIRNNFFGGALDTHTVTNYLINSRATNELNIPLFIRTPDSEYIYRDYHRLCWIRMNLYENEKFYSSGNGKNKRLIDILLRHKLINYDNVYWAANSSDLIDPWVRRCLYDSVGGDLRVVSLEQIENNTLYISDDILFNYTLSKKKYPWIEISDDYEHQISYLGYLKGTVAKARPPILNKIFKNNEYEIPVSINGPGASEIEAKFPNIILNEEGIFDEDCIKWMNKQMAFIHFGKGKRTCSYISKTVWDCAVNKTLSLIYLPCDRNRVIFGDDRWYFSNEQELFEIFEKLKDPNLRRQWIEEQREWLENVLETKMRPMFKFNQFCKPKEWKVKELF